VTPPDLALHLLIIRLDHGHTCRTPLVDVLVPEPQVCIFLFCFSGTHRVTFQRERERYYIVYSTVQQEYVHCLEQIRTNR
jgi:hypothetical protein